MIIFVCSLLPNVGFRATVKDDAATPYWYRSEFGNTHEDALGYLADLLRSERRRLDKALALVRAKQAELAKEAESSGKD